MLRGKRNVVILALVGVQIIWTSLYLFRHGGYGVVFSRQSGSDVYSAEIGNSEQVLVENRPESTAEEGPARVAEEPPKETVSKPAETPVPLSDAKLQQYLHAIQHTEDKTLDKPECPAMNTSRYEPLRYPETDMQSHVDYFFALNLRNCVDLLPRLLGSVVEVMRYLGPERCALSIVEGNSPDGTGQVLDALQPILKEHGFTYHYQNSNINPSEDARILRLAQLRNLALEPLTSKLRARVSKKTTVLFINDVAACPDDILELAYQKRNLGADMTCAMDWSYIGPNPNFYDVWVSRAINGDLFFNISPNGGWENADDLFWNEPVGKNGLEKSVPFQVFACWNGATAFTAEPILNGLKFRISDEPSGECFQGEPQLFCKDLWWRGFGKIAVVPAVNLEYNIENGRRIKALKGFVNDLVRNQTDAEVKFDWKGPPEEVKCMPTFDRQSWLPWNESLPIGGEAKKVGGLERVSS